uniref:Uncharacterized protein n=1 Tax=Accipiter nisus TaxID=211598 RepID=A0A8B9LYT5_9AVES
AVTTQTLRLDLCLVPGASSVRWLQKNCNYCEVYPKARENRGFLGITKPVSRITLWDTWCMDYGNPLNKQHWVTCAQEP